MKLLSAMLLLALGASAQETGVISGQSLIDAGCPVLTPESQCAPEPYPTRVTILNARGGVLRTIATKRDGRFLVELPAGNYTLVPYMDPPVCSDGICGPVWPQAHPVKVTVPEGCLARVTILYDTGAR